MKPAGTSREACNDLCCHTLAHRDPSFVHQHVVDAFAAQTANARTKPITLAFALVGLYLHLEKKLSGRRVQRVHQHLVGRKRSWPAFPLPDDRGALTVADMVAVPPGPQRDKAIEAWCVSVWAVFHSSRPAVVELLHQCGIE